MAASAPGRKLPLELMHGWILAWIVCLTTPKQIIFVDHIYFRWPTANRRKQMYTIVGFTGLTKLLIIFVSRCLADENSGLLSSVWARPTKVAQFSSAQWANEIKLFNKPTKL
jgi:hypothetical protein